jgi:predicted DNA-binding transcriptional regulator AlpA
MRKSRSNAVAEGFVGGNHDKKPKRLALSETRPVPRRGLSRVEAAMYIGISSSKFDELVADGRMPKPKRLDGRKLWDLRELDLTFDALGDDAEFVDDTWMDFGQHPVKR